MKKTYVKPEMDVQEFAAEDMIMNDNGSAVTCVWHETECNGSYVVVNPGCITVLPDGTCSLVVS